MKIGLPRALLYYRYQNLWTEFFRQLGHETVVSPETTAPVLADGIASSVDESCLPDKIFMGHVRYLADKCDYILIPRIASFAKNEKVCVKFNALVDIVRNTLKVNILDYNIDVLRGKTERDGFISMGTALGAGKREALASYAAAMAFDEEIRRKQRTAELLALGAEGLKILAVGHPYNLCDPFLGAPVLRLLKDAGAVVVRADILADGRCAKTAENFAPGLYWTFSKELLGAADFYRTAVDGMVFVSAFPCGPDALAHELALRRLKGVPVCRLVVDELFSGTGLATRIESFLDIVSATKKRSAL